MNLTAGAVALLLAGSLALPGAALAQEAPADPNAVPMLGNKFVPVEKTVTVGTTVTWMNMDAEEHDVVTNDLTIISPVIKPGETFAYTFDTPGTYTYLCDLHVAMEGVINVTAASAGEAEAAPAA